MHVYVYVRLYLLHEGDDTRQPIERLIGNTSDTKDKSRCFDAILTSFSRL